MEHSRRFVLLLTSVAGALLAGSAVAQAQTYPTRPITLIMPYPAGGNADAIPRVMADHMRASLGQPLIIENVGGAGASIGAGRLARAAPNGYTIGVGSSQSHVLNGAVLSLSYDLVTDFEPIALLVSTPILMVGRSGVPAKNLKELLAWLKANPGKVTQGHFGAGGGPHLCGVELQNLTGSQWTLVPYRGAAPAMQDLVGGQIDLLCTTLASSHALVRSGQARAYAVMDGKRLVGAPDIPTVDEAGLPGFYIAAWFGLYAPKGTPKDILSTLNAAVVNALADPGVRARFTKLGLDAPPPDQRTREALAALQKADIEKWWPIIKAAGIKVE